MSKLTLDEAIKHCLEVAEQNDTQAEKWREEGGEEWGKTTACRECAADHRQLAEWLIELKKAKRLLKAAVEDFRILGTMLEDGHGHCTAEISCDECVLGGGNLADDCQWRHEAEVLKLIEEEEE